MTSETTREFRECLSRLPSSIRKYAKRVYKRWESDPFHPALQFKQVHQALPIYTVRIGVRWRAIGLRKEDRMVWFWIGSHEKYNKKIRQFRR
ncbi:MAG TPA: hypothetical protein HPP77_03715 [Candidatus Hydrogenedentes bacterium]|nr:hypothetical protein [Candidatus Hydrogenedentota bacterium]HIJ74515.1 hypothetical protein [Candidatus Hydrogenedentota bacterium]